MKILGKNILVKTPDKQSVFDEDNQKTLGQVVGIGEEVSIDINVGEEIYFHPSSLTYINGEEWDVINESGVICKKGNI